jgi:endonuclease/exonuclease/phosphatase (EEP) superfamily protein YafD
VIVDALGWVITAIVGTLLLTQLLPVWRNRPVIALHSFTLQLMPLAPLGLVVSIAAQNLLMGIVALVQCAACGVLVNPVFRSRGSKVEVGSLRVAQANVLFKNEAHASTAARAIAAHDADVVVLTEFAPVHEVPFEEELGARYEHRVSLPAANAGGIAVWSRIPFVDAATENQLGREAVVVTVCAHDEPIRIVAVHPFAPTTRQRLADWVPGIRKAGRLAASPGPPTMIIGDLNASRWHPPLRELLNDGWTDAHEAVGKGFTPSWPTDGRHGLRPFMRLDHALLDHRLGVADVADFEIPGSDHRGFVVTVAPTST